MTLARKAFIGSGGRKGWLQKRAAAMRASVANRRMEAFSG
jgi:hypothetical protein